MYYGWWMYISLINEWFLRSGVLRAANIYFCTKVFLSYNILSSLSRALRVDVCWLWMYSFSFLRSIQSITIVRKRCIATINNQPSLMQGYRYLHYWCEILLRKCLHWSTPWQWVVLRLGWCQISYQDFLVEDVAVSSLWARWVARGDCCQSCKVSPI